jgi:GGDEF domain-containing protein
MSTEVRPLQVLVVSPDISLLHETTWILDAVKYKVQTTTDIDENALWRRYSQPDFVILDGRNVAEPTADTFAHDSDKPQYRIFLYDPAKTNALAGWYAAGAHDALRTPLSRGELLARLRAGARYLEFERRLQHRSSRSSVPGMYSRRGLVRKLQTVAGGDDGDSAQRALLATSIDWYADIRRRNGESVSRNLVSTAARAIRRATGDNAVSAYVGGGRFVTLIAGQSAAAIRGISVSLAKDFASRESFNASTPRTTLTSAVMPWSAGCKVERLLADVLETLKLAEQSGGDCAIDQDEFRKELAAWQEELSSGNPFANVVAQDIMESFPALLEHGADQSELAEALRRAGVPIRPYVDHGGQLVGIAGSEDCAGQACNGQAVGSMAVKPPTPEIIPHNASFSEIYDAFSSRGGATLVVTAGKHPLGYITCDGFLTMIDPLHAESFKYTDKSADELAYLVVPSMIGEAPELAAN